MMTIVLYSMKRTRCEDEDCDDEVDDDDDTLCDVVSVRDLLRI